jgi:predicted RNase H-like HicB family nuclease
MRDVQCFARGREGDWEAICLDFDIAVQGVSFNEAREALEDAVASYVEAARQEDAQTRERLLNRRAPLRVALLWSIRVLASAWRARSNGEAAASFPVACPA